MFHQLLAEILPSLTKGRPNNNNNTNNNNNKAKCIPGGTLRVLAGKNSGFVLSFFHELNRPGQCQTGSYCSLVMSKAF
jgi:hypothetical protein